MIAGLIARVGASRWARATLRWGLLAAVLVFLLDPVSMIPSSYLRIERVCRLRGSGGIHA